MATTKNRIEWLDAMRGFTMVMVVAYHVGLITFAESARQSASMSLMLRSLSSRTPKGSDSLSYISSEDVSAEATDSHTATLSITADLKQHQFSARSFPLGIFSANVFSISCNISVLAF